MSNTLRDWVKDNIPAELRPAVERVEFLFADAEYRFSLMTQGLCYASLHGVVGETDRLKHEKKHFLSLLRKADSVAEKQFEDRIRPDTHPAIINAFFEAQCSLLLMETRRLFDELLQIGYANTALLKVHPVEWAKRLADQNIDTTESSFEHWLIYACDGGNSYITGDDPVRRIELNTWRAPKLIDMNPAGNAPYDSETAWDREDDEKTQLLLFKWGQSGVERLQWELFDIAGDAAVSLAKQGKHGGTLESNIGNATAHYVSSNPTTAGELRGNRVPDKPTEVSSDLPSGLPLVLIKGRRSGRHANIRSSYKIAIREGLVSTGLSASAQVVATWIAEKFQNIEFPHITSRYGERSDLGQLYRSNPKFRAQFDRDVTDMRKFLKRSAD